MKAIKLFILFTVFSCLTGFSQTKLPVKFRIEKQAMSTPMSSLEDIFFASYYISKPLNIRFDGSLLDMYYDNGAAFVKKNVTEVNRNTEYEDDNLVLETIRYTANDNVSDTISLVIDYSVGYVQIVLPTKNSKGDYIGYTSYRKFVKDNELALR